MPPVISFQSVSVPIFIGMLLFVLVPSPNCELLFRPHAQSVPSVFIARLCARHAFTEDQFVADPI